jgi:hemerythrin-like metal-binding protein
MLLSRDKNKTRNNMPTANWKEEYSVNVKEIDTQHQHLIELVTNLHNSVSSRQGKDELEQLLIELVDYTKIHFSTEEELMKEHDYPGSHFHCKDHKMILDHLDELVAVVAKGRYPTFYSDYDVSSDWAMVHINEYDTKLGEFLNSKNIF